MSDIKQSDQELRLIIGEDRVNELSDLFMTESNAEYTQEWREDLTSDEQALITLWDEAYSIATIRIIERIRAAQARNARQ